MNRENRSAASSEPVRCAIYARTASELELCNTSEQQIQRCRKAAREKGWTVAENCVRADYGGSGTSIQSRTGLEELIALAATRPRPFDYLMCASIDRLARNMEITGQIVGTVSFHGVKIYCVSGDLDSAEPKFWCGLCCMDRGDENLSEKLGKRTRRGRLAKAENETAAVPAASTR